MTYMQYLKQQTVKSRMPPTPSDDCEDNISIRSFCSAHIRCTAPTHDALKRQTRQAFDNRLNVKTDLLNEIQWHFRHDHNFKKYVAAV